MEIAWYSRRASRWQSEQSHRPTICHDTSTANKQESVRDFAFVPAGSFRGTVRLHKPVRPWSVGGWPRHGRTRHAFTRFRNKTQCTPGCPPWPTLKHPPLKVPGIYPCNRKAASSAGEKRASWNVYTPSSSSTPAATKSHGAATTQGRKNLWLANEKVWLSTCVFRAKRRKPGAVNLRRYGCFLTRRIIS